jgi:predicted amidophosphoribosyltransferase
MMEAHQGNLANLWAVGGNQADPIKAEGHRLYYKFCPKCGWQLTGKFSTCPRCNADLRIKVCPYCRGEIPANKGVCPRCSAPLE